MGDIAGMNDEGWLHAKGLDLADCFLERTEGIGVGWLVEPDMAVADLQEGQPARFGSRRLADNAHRTRHTACNGPQHAGTGPGLAFQDLAPADAAPIVVLRSHRQSPLKPRWLPRTRSRLSKIYSPDFRGPFAAINAAMTSSPGSSNRFAPDCGAPNPSRCRDAPRDAVVAPS